MSNLEHLDIIKRRLTCQHKNKRLESIRTKQKEHFHVYRCGDCGLVFMGSLDENLLKKAVKELENEEICVH